MDLKFLKNVMMAFSKVDILDVEVMSHKVASVSIMSPCFVTIIDSRLFKIIRTYI